MKTEYDASELYEQYHGKILGYFRSRISDPTAAEDLCSDVFVKVCANLDGFDDSKASVSTWIYTIAKNTMTDYFRTRHVHEELTEEIEDGSDIEESVCNEDMLERLADALETLDERERDIIVLHYYSGKTLGEIAQKCGISYAYVKVLHSKALSKLRKKL